MTASQNRTAHQVASHLRVAADLMAGRSQFSSDSFEAQYATAEYENYSVCRAIQAIVDPGIDNAQLERHVSDKARAAGATLGRVGIYIPFGALARDLVVGTPTAGGNLVATSTSREIAAWLRPASFCAAAGATFYTGIGDNLSVPFLSGGASAQLVSENSPAPATQPTFGVASLKPRTVTATAVVSRRLDLQSPFTDALVSADLAAAVGQLIDYLALNGSGAGEEPTGILTHGGIGVVALGANGGPMTWAKLVDMEHAVDLQNAGNGSLAYVTSPNVRKQLRTTAVFTGGGSPVWGKDRGGDNIGGTTAFSTTHVPTNLVKGTATNCSAVAYGRWSDLLIGIWGGGIDVMVDRRFYSTTGAVRLVVALDMDVAVRRPQAFSVCKDIVTT